MENELNELAELVERVGEMGLDLLRSNDSRPDSIPGTKDPDRPSLIVIAKDRFGKPSMWIYGPYMIFAGSNGMASAGLMSGFDLLFQAPQDIDHMPMAMLMAKIDQIMANVKKKGWKPPEYLNKNVRKAAK